MTRGRVLTAAEVKARLREAALTFETWEACEPRPGPSGVKVLWPAILRAAVESYGQYTPSDLARLSRQTPPPPAAISRMWESIDWLQFLSADDRRFLWAWARGVPQWKLAQRHRKTERTIRLWIVRACGVIACRLANNAE